MAKKAVKKGARKARATAGLSRAQMNMITTPRQKILTPRVSAARVREAQNAILNVTQKCVLTSAKYNEAALKTGEDARKAFDKAEVENDRALLESLFTEDYNFVDPFGVVGNRDSTIKAILSGQIRKESFRTTAESLQIHDDGNTIVSSGKFAMKGSVKVRSRSSGTVRSRDISGTYLSTHTYVTRDKRLQLAATQLTLQPKK